MSQKENWCKVITTDEGCFLLTMPDGTVIPAQVLTRVSQDTEEYRDGIGTALIKVMVNLTPDKK